MWTSIKFLNLKHATESIFVYSIQLSMYLFKHETCKFVYTPSYYHFYISAKSCLMSFVKPSHAFKVKSILDSSVTICLDKVVYFTFEQTPKNWAIHFTLLGKELPQQNMLIKKKILMLKFTSDSWGEKNEPWQSLQIHAQSWKIILNPETQLGSAGCLHIHYWPRLRSMWLDIVVVVVCTEWSLIVIIGCF